MSRSTLLQIFQDVCPLVGVSTPSSVIGSLDDQVNQMRALLQDEGRRLVTEYKWQILRRRATWTATATESQGNIYDLTEAGLKSIINGTIWDDTLQRAMWGPTDDIDWQLAQSTSLGPINQFKIMDDELLLNPVPTAGNTLSLLYETTSWIEADDGTALERFAADTDVPRFPTVIMTKGLEMRWKREKGLPYADALMEYADLVDTYKMSDGTKALLSLDRPTRKLVPGIFVPAGNWDVT
jgi:hypothetical protein